MSENIRIRTSPNDKFVNLKIEQDFDFIEILSLKISQANVYQTFCSDYGVIVGRVSINGGFGLPNSKVSIFIPITDEDKNNPTIAGLYPYTKISDKDSNGIRYNLLPKESDNSDVCYTPIGTFPSKREVLDNEDALYVYQKYYKYTAVTNYAGDYMIFGVPLGTYTLHIDADISDVGILTQKPYDLIDQGTPTKFFTSPTKFKKQSNLDSLPQVKSANIGVTVNPFWGDVNNCEIGINRVDVDLNYTVRPAAIFMGSLFGDTNKNSVNKECAPRASLGKLCEQIASEGSIEMLRKTIDDEIERFDIDGGRVIDSNGSWAYQIPMNLDYVVTDEFGNLVPSNVQNVGVPTRARVRFRIGLDDSGNSGRLRTKGTYLIPHNPNVHTETDFTFDETTKDVNFRDIYWNKIYTVKNFIPRTQKRSRGGLTEDYIGIKEVDACAGDKNPFPYNRVSAGLSPLFSFLCILINIIATIVAGINVALCILKTFGVDPISVTCDDKSIKPGCGDSISDLTSCMSASLAESLGLIRFNFYNDWINGTLYFPALKYKRKKGGNDKFCDYDCSTTSNNCKNSEIMDTGVNNLKDYQTLNFTNGYVSKVENRLYYTPITNGVNYKLLATDLVCLGSTLDCDWQGYPKIVQYLDETTYKLPPILEEIDDNVRTAGILDRDKTFGLFLNVNCLGLSADGIQSSNIRRQCELGVDIPESDNGVSIRTVTINQIFDPTDSNTSISRYIRDSFYLLNINGPELSYYPPFDTAFLDNKALGTSFEIDGNLNNLNHNNGKAYMDFRNYQVTSTNIEKDMSMQPYGNSYFMYFGLIPGKNAYTKLIANYFTECTAEKNNEFIIDTSILNNSITITFLGGTSPFTYTLTGDNYFYPSSSVVITETINNIPSGDYIIKATDSLNTIVTKKITV